MNPVTPALTRVRTSAASRTPCRSAYAGCSLHRNPHPRRPPHRVRRCRSRSSASWASSLASHWHDHGPFPRPHVLNGSGFLPSEIVSMPLVAARSPQREPGYQRCGTGSNSPG
eukprot:CAMPEP_0196752446 /NCGR_PEP_ID=MMETSP1091-20130531/87211_1 /TAXON_ID=302021 /ORGANISM="Rhodomonas sp., Strain CCMP768" /LENGTH=112 /DNA_ID=CAMNT_0042100387 /DNA_START=16 /DNA_END=354 /DNA_ORIENTATION=+